MHKVLSAISRTAIVDACHASHGHRLVIGHALCRTRKRATPNETIQIHATKSKTIDTRNQTFPSATTHKPAPYAVTAARFETQRDGHDATLRHDVCVGRQFGENLLIRVLHPYGVQIVHEDTHPALQQGGDQADTSGPQKGQKIGRRPRVHVQVDFSSECEEGHGLHVPGQRGREFGV